jgi:hypothetical protein
VINDPYLTTNVTNQDQAFGQYVEVDLTIQTTLNIGKNLKR